MGVVQPKNGGGVNICEVISHAVEPLRVGPVWGALIINVPLIRMGVRSFFLL